MDELLMETVARDGNYLFWYLSIALKDEGRYNKLNKKIDAVSLCCDLRVKPFSHQLYLLVQLRMKEVSSIHF
jgi:hypothetical protein